MIDSTDQRAWCVLTLNSDRSDLLAIYSILNILSFLIPLLILGRLKSKRKTIKNNQINIQNSKTQLNQRKCIRTEIVKHKYILIGSIFLGLLSLPRLVLTFIFVCTKLNRNSIPSLLAYLVAFLPSMAIIFALICPSKTYRSTLLRTLKKITSKIEFML